METQNRARHGVLFALIACLAWPIASGAAQDLEFDPEDAAAEDAAAEDASPEQAEPSVEDATPRSMDQLLDGALDGRKPIELPKDKAAEKPATVPLPEAPTAESLIEVIKQVAPALRACAKGQAGNAQLVVVLRGDGRAESARLTGPPFGDTESGRCLEGVLRRAHFPRFRRPQFRVRIPLALR